MNLLELPLLSRKYTWYTNNSASRIDRVFVDTEWLSRFSELKLWGLRRSVSIPSPMLVDCEKINWGLRPSRSLDMWFSNPSFVKLVKSEWKKLESVPLAEKLKKLKAPLKKWSKEVFGDVDKIINELEAELKRLDNLSDRQILNESDLARRKALTAQLWMWQKRKEILWFQLFRSTAIKDKDRNTKLS